MTEATPACPWCGATTHTQFTCPRLAAIDFDPASGKLRRVEFFPPPREPKADVEEDYPRLKSIGAPGNAQGNDR